jgi:hypothetical protein
MVLVALSLLALIGSAALVLLAGSVEWQKNQLQQLADQAALDSALKIGIGCDAGKASTVITEADNFLATQRTRTGSLSIAGGSCTAPYAGTDTFAGGLSATINYPYRAHQHQVEVVLTLTLPISFGGEVGKTNTSVVRRAVAQALPASAPTVSATTLTCSSGQVNVAGSVLAQNLIVRSGTCALYAHTRFDAASSTYSDLGNVSVYTDGQSWTAPGTCVAGSNSGSSSAICSDGFELSGHNTPACAAAATSYLSPGDKTVNPDPCAAGTGPHPVAPVSTALPPEPNADPVAIATLQGTGGAACLPGGVYPNILVGGLVVGTGLGPAPLRDASGFYHFKPSCYGYLNLNGISSVQIGPEVGPSTSSVTPTLPVASTLGTLLVANISAGPNATQFTGPAGWVFANGVNQPGEGRNEIWYRANNPGGISNATFTLNAGNTAVAQMSEWRNVLAVAPLDRTGTVAVAANSASVTVSTSAATTFTGDLAIVNDGSLSKPGQTITQGTGWTSMANDPPHGYTSEYRLDSPPSVVSETLTTNVATTWSVVIATFKPALPVTAAVFDPGFYYFNGSGFVGGGGVCLNGGRLMARDVTMEFVNQAGFSSGTCAAGGGANAGGLDQFGSAPCSLLACPPNTPADSPNNLTWFAAPCSTAPAGDAASCPGSSWCLPAGDRSCANVLIWAPSSNTGQFAIKGAAAKHWLLGSVYWPGTCTDTVNGTSTIAGTVFCGNLTISAAAGTATAVGSDYGISNALVEAILVE